jgi:hypothetical protein
MLTRLSGSEIRNGCTRRRYLRLVQYSTAKKIKSYFVHLSIYYIVCDTFRGQTVMNFDPETLVSNRKLSDNPVFFRQTTTDSIISSLHKISSTFEPYV